VQVLKTIDDALAIRNYLLGAFEQAEQCNDPDRVRRFLTSVVLGAEPTGVEMAGTIAELARTTLAREFKHIDPQEARVVLYEAASRVLSGFSVGLSSHAKGALENLGIDVRLDQAAKEIDAHGLLVGKTRIDTPNMIWRAGAKARPAAAWLGANACRNGAVRVAPDCSAPGWPEIFAIGDVSTLDNASGNALPRLAAVAKQQERYVGMALKSRIAGKAPPPPFRYPDLGAMAIIGRLRAVAHFGRVDLTGFVAWLAWSLIHLMILVDFHSRLIVYANWSWAWFTHGRGARLLTSLPQSPRGSAP
jgi:NADH:ubiquinone reductase (H+-translocating)